MPDSKMTDLHRANHKPEGLFEDGAQATRPAGLLGASSQYIDNPKRYTESYTGFHHLAHKPEGVFGMTEKETDGGAQGAQEAQAGGHEPSAAPAEGGDTTEIKTEAPQDAQPATRDGSPTTVDVAQHKVPRVQGQSAQYDDDDDEEAPDCGDDVAMKGAADTHHTDDDPKDAETEFKELQARMCRLEQKLNDLRGRQEIEREALDMQPAGARPTGDVRARGVGASGATKAESDDDPAQEAQADPAQVTALAVAENQYKDYRTTGWEGYRPGAQDDNDIIRGANHRHGQVTAVFKGKRRLRENALLCVSGSRFRAKHKNPRDKSLGRAFSVRTAISATSCVTDWTSAVKLASVASADGATHVRAAFAPRPPETLGCPKPGGIGLSVPSHSRPPPQIYQSEVWRCCVRHTARQIGWQRERPYYMTHVFHVVHVAE